MRCNECKSELETVKIVIPIYKTIEQKGMADQLRYQIMQSEKNPETRNDRALKIMGKAADLFDQIQEHLTHCGRSEKDFVKFCKWLSRANAFTEPREVMTDVEYTDEVRPCRVCGRMPLDDKA